MTLPPAVIDTNVVVSGLLTSLPASPTVRILDAMLGARFRFALSIDLLAEYREVLLRPRIRARHGFTATKVDLILTDVASNGFVVDVERMSGERAGGDEHLWRLMRREKAAVLVTGDKRLFGREVGERVVTAREFEERLEDAPGRVR